MLALSHGGLAPPPTGNPGSAPGRGLVVVHIFTFFENQTYINHFSV